MNTPTHVIAAAAILARPERPKRNLMILAGALVPDVSIYIMCVWALATGQFNDTLWSVTYWQEPWQTIGAITNSTPLALLLLGIGVWRKWPLLSVFALALLIHGVLDFPLHADDAHRHFWPVTDWRFESPISYWNREHNGGLGSLLDAAILLIGIFILWHRFSTRWVRVALGLLTLLCLIAMTASLFFALS